MTLKEPGSHQKVAVLRAMFPSAARENDFVKKGQGRGVMDERKKDDRF